MNRYLHRIIREEIERMSEYNDVLSSFSWHDVDFTEGDVEDGCERLVVSIRGIEIPEGIINLKAQQTRLCKIQLHTFISDEFQRKGIATKIYIAFVHMFGSVYSGFGRMMNPEGIMSIYRKMMNEPDIEVSLINDYKNTPIGIEARLK